MIQILKKSVQITILFLFLGHTCWGQTPDRWPKRVLITNDNGIEDIKIRALAEAFSEIAETYVVAPSIDRSGTSNFLQSIRAGKLEVVRHNFGEKIHAYAVDGYPADCVFLGLAGILRDNPPDLIVSGINGGPNLGIDWVFSGTIGAARVASLSNIPVIAVSGLKSSIPESVEAATQWVVQLVQEPWVRQMPPLHYLTISIPRSAPNEIKGARLARRHGVNRYPIFKNQDAADSTTQTWTLSGLQPIKTKANANSDQALYDAGYIAMVFMALDEHAVRENSPNFMTKQPSVPSWPPKSPQ